MKKFAKSVLGVTLLEIMLVLAIAAMIIVMSVRYYQSATNNQQANALLQMVQGITAAADGLAQAAGTYSTASTASIKALMPNTSMNTPWGSAITLTTGSGSTYGVTIATVPIPICTLLKSRLAANTKYTGASGNACSSVASFTYTYDSTK